MPWPGRGIVSTTTNYNGCGETFTPQDMGATDGFWQGTKAGSCSQTVRWWIPRRVITCVPNKSWVRVGVEF